MDCYVHITYLRIGRICLWTQWITVSLRILIASADLSILVVRQMAYWSRRMERAISGTYSIRKCTQTNGIDVSCCARVVERKHYQIRACLYTRAMLFLAYLGYEVNRSWQQTGWVSHCAREGIYYLAKCTYLQANQSDMYMPCEITFVILAFIVRWAWSYFL